VPGGSYFFTVALAQRSQTLFTEPIAWLRQAFRQARSLMPFTIDAIVVVPDHRHCIWTLPPEDKDYPSRWKFIKMVFSRQFPKTERRSASRLAKGERGIWQRRYWEHTLRNDSDFARHVDYIHYNPVKHAYVTAVKDWPYSSFHRFVRKGVYPANWAGNLELTDTGEFGA
jgi:putative transposase